MDQRILGKNGLQVSEIGLGCMGMTQSYPPFPDKSESIVLAWLLAQKPFIVPIPGTKRLYRLQENIGASEVSFTPQELRKIQTKLEGFQIAGVRYPDEMEKMTGL